MAVVLAEVVVVSAVVAKVAVIGVVIVAGVSDRQQSVVTEVNTTVLF
jgi:hypothetical protein